MRPGSTLPIEHALDDAFALNVIRRRRRRISGAGSRRGEKYLRLCGLSQSGMSTGGPMGYGVPPLGFRRK
jgi:hypothetical protein